MQKLLDELADAQTRYDVASAVMAERATNRTAPTVREVRDEYLARLRLISTRQALYDNAIRRVG